MFYVVGSLRPQRIDYLFPLTALKKGRVGKTFFFFTSIGPEGTFETMKPLEDPWIANIDLFD